jgi:hypothetical protein
MTVRNLRSSLIAPSYAVLLVRSKLVSGFSQREKPLLLVNRGRLSSIRMLSSVEPVYRSRF